MEDNGGFAQNQGAFPEFMLTESIFLKLDSPFLTPPPLICFLSQWEMSWVSTTLPKSLVYLPSHSFVHSLIHSIANIYSIYFGDTSGLDSQPGCSYVLKLGTDDDNNDDINNNWHLLSISATERYLNTVQRSAKFFCNSNILGFAD